jgi:hypothetical protein
MNSYRFSDIILGVLVRQKERRITARQQHETGHLEAVA